MSNLNTKEWISKIQKGDKESIHLFVQTFEKDLMRFCFYLANDNSEAEDLCQDTFIKAITKIHLYDQKHNLKSWLYKIAQNRYIDLIRSPKKHKTDIMDEPPEQRALDPKTELKNTVQFILGKLNDQERAVILLVDMEGHSYDEAAKILNISLDNMNVRIHRARKKFLNIMTEFKLEVTGVFKLPPTGGSNVA